MAKLRNNRKSLIQFDWSNYISINKLDFKGSDGSKRLQAQKHWLEKGQFSGLESNIEPFDWKYYTTAYGLKLNKKKASNDWLIKGMLDGKNGSPVVQIVRDIHKEKVKDKKVNKIKTRDDRKEVVHDSLIECVGQCCTKYLIPESNRDVNYCDIFTTLTTDSSIRFEYTEIYGKNWLDNPDTSYIIPLSNDNTGVSTCTGIFTSWPKRYILIISNDNGSMDTVEESIIKNAQEVWFSDKLTYDKYVTLAKCGGSYEHKLIDVSRTDNENKLNLNKIKTRLMIRQSPGLFHKYILGLRNPENDIRYEIVHKGTQETDYNDKYKETNDNRTKGSVITHLHQYDLSKIFSYFERALKVFTKHTDIICTYVKDDLVNRERLMREYDNITLLKVPNYGMDIGGKFSATQYIVDSGLSPSHVFYFHSKTDKRHREHLLKPFVGDFEGILNRIGTDDSYYPDNCVLDGRKDKNNTNQLYWEEMAKYFNVSDINYNFHYGNMYILPWNKCVALYTDKLLYNSLNDEKSFDYNWVKHYYRLKDVGITECYDKYKENKWHGNCLAVKDKIVRDGMVEHMFERIVDKKISQIGSNIIENIVSEGIKYDIIHENKVPEFLHNTLWAHLHCYDIAKFDEIYGEYIENIMRYFSVIITFSIGDDISEKLKLYNAKYILLKIKNKGFDIGGKICAFTFLKKKKINYQHIFMLHSKSNISHRMKYWNPFLLNIDRLHYICSIINHYDLIIPNILSDGDWNMKEGYTINKYYYTEYNKLMNYRHITSKFVEGNCLIASRKIIDAVFGCDLYYIYSKLNDVTTFDYNWVKFQYKLWGKSYIDVYDFYITNKLNGNSMCHNKEKLICDYDFIFNTSPPDICNNFLKDGSYEHLWERLWINVCENINGNIKVLEDPNIHPTNHIYNFDTNLYKLLNNESNKNNSIESISNIKQMCKGGGYIYSLRQILEELPIDFDISQYARDANLQLKNKYEIINHYLHNKDNHNEGNDRKSWIYLQKKFNSIKTFILIFPQFHEIPENNKFWGNGFTEWWNVRKTYQIHDKHLPMHPHSDIGYYNILDIETRERWNKYAEDYGFFGYIYYHYWFSNGIVMNQPLDRILKDGQPDKPWFMNWVNENWTKRWDGGNNDILLDIKLDIDLCNKHFDTLLKYFNHHNYYKINNKPCLGVYKPEEIPDEYIKKMIKLSKDNGFDGITFIKTMNNNIPCNCKINNDNYCEFEFEFPPNYSGSLVDTRDNNVEYYIDKEYIDKPHNYNIEQHYRALINTKESDKKLIRGIMPCWDNFPRHNNLTSDSHIQLNSNSFIFYLCLVKQFLLILRENGEYHITNSLNEWAEQCVLEPSIQNEYSYLEAYKLAKQTDLDNVNEKMLDLLINY